jgi:hypothetical protein
MTQYIHLIPQQSLSTNMVSEPEFFFLLPLTLAMALFIYRQFSAPCGHHVGRHEATALRAWLEAIIKEAEDTEAQAAAAHCHVQAARLLLEEEESKATALEQMAIAARQHVPPMSSSSSSPATASQLIPTASSTYEDTVITGLHLQATIVLNVHQPVNIVLDSSTNYAS